jgi:GAF domain-containing protein
LDRHGWSAKTLAVPVFSHGVVVAAALYGVHKSGTDLDAREIEMLERLANAAGQAYNRIEIASLRDEVRNLQEDAAEPAPARIKA